MVPKLTGQKAAYLVSALKAYKSGERDFATMRAIAADLSDKDMEDIAAYYGSRDHDGGARNEDDHDPARHRHPRRRFRRARASPLRRCRSRPQEVRAVQGLPRRSRHQRHARVSEPRRAACRLPRRRHQPLQERQAQEPDHAGQVANLTQRDIADLTAYYSRLPGLKQP
jgi:cytochrome c553